MDKTYTDQDEIVNMAQVGDEYKLYGFVTGLTGASKGYQLKVNSISVTINAIEYDTTYPKVVSHDESSVQV
jgi:hypothetical protein